VAKQNPTVSPVITAVGFAGLLVVLLPVIALLSRVPWSNLASQLSSESSINAIRVSLITSVLAALISVLLGVPLAWYLARGPEAITKWLRPIVISPLVMPPTVAGLALLTLMGRNGLLGKFIYEQTGWAMPFTMAAVVLAGVFVGMPFLVLVVEAVFRQIPVELEEAAQTLGANPSRVFWRISFPLARGGVISGLVLAWARALGEFGATLTFAGSLPGVTRTLPMEVYVAMEVDPASAYSISAMLVVIAITVVFLLRSNLIKAFNGK